MAELFYASNGYIGRRIVDGNGNCLASTITAQLTALQAIANNTATIATTLSTISTTLSAIKAQTDKLQFDGTNRLKTTAI